MSATTTAQNIYNLNYEQIVSILQQLNYNHTTNDLFNKMIATLLLYNNQQIVASDQEMVTHPNFSKMYLIDTYALLSTLESYEPDHGFEVNNNPAQMENGRINILRLLLSNVFDSVIIFEGEMSVVKN